MKFERPRGLAGSTPRNWVDRELPRCPFCKVAGPQWEGAMQFKWPVTLYHFRCPSCQGHLSIPMTAVNKGTLISPAEMMMHAATRNVLTVEDVGRSGSSLRIGSEHTPEELRKLALPAAAPRPPPPKIVPAAEFVCDSCGGKITATMKSCIHCGAVFEE